MISHDSSCTILVILWVEVFFVTHNFLMKIHCVAHIIEFRDGQASIDHWKPEVRPGDPEGSTRPL